MRCGWRSKRRRRSRARAGEIVLAGDTTIALGRRILPPADTEAVQRELLGKLSGRRHHACPPCA